MPGGKVGGRDETVALHSSQGGEIVHVGLMSYLHV